MADAYLLLEEEQRRRSTSTAPDDDAAPAHLDGRGGMLNSFGVPTGPFDPSWIMEQLTHEGWEEGEPEVEEIFPI